jgi:Flp pilus assembly protein TadG
LRSRSAIIRKLRSAWCGTRRDECGASAVEFAILTPFLLLLCTGIIEGSLLIYTRGNMEHVARQAARAAAIGTFTDTEAENFIVDKMADSLGSPIATASVNFVDGATPIEDEVVVIVTIQASELSGLLPFGLIPITALSAAVTMHTEES